MAHTAVKHPRLMNTPEWVFPWRGRKRSYFPMVFAHLLVAAVFILLLGVVKVRLVTPKPMAPRKASLIYLADDAQGRALALKAQEGGPFPSRFEPSQWEGMAALEAEVLAATRGPSRPYVPTLRELPKDSEIPPVELAAKGEPVFPKRLPTARAAMDPAKFIPVPTLYPLSGITAAALPTELPPLDGAVKGAMISTSWQFLVRLDPSGGVVECVSLEEGGQEGTRELGNWLRGIRFPSAPGKSFRWIAVGVGFNNQPANEPDAH